MPLNRKGLHQFAVYWEFCGNNPDGSSAFNDPVQISVRWEEALSESSQPTEQPIRHAPLTVQVDRRVRMDSKMWKGCLDDLPENFNVNLAHKVTSYEETPNIKGKNPVMYVTLTRK